MCKIAKNGSKKHFRKIILEVLFSYSLILNFNYFKGLKCSIKIS